MKSGLCKLMNTYSQALISSLNPLLNTWEENILLNLTQSAIVPLKGVTFNSGNLE